MAIGTIISGVFLYVSTLANTNQAVLACKRTSVDRSGLNLTNIGMK